MHNNNKDNGNDDYTLNVKLFTHIYIIMTILLLDNDFKQVIHISVSAHQVAQIITGQQQLRCQPWKVATGGFVGCLP